MTRPQRIAVLFSTAMALSASSTGFACWDAAATHYQVNSNLLHAIARTESALNPRAVHRNPNGSRDIGLMQINSSWLPLLERHGISEHDLLRPCTNIYVGAWILAQNFQRLGTNWEAIGAYNARSPALRRAYAWRIFRVLQVSTAASEISKPAPASIDVSLF